MDSGDVQAVRNMNTPNTPNDPLEPYARALAWFAIGFAVWVVLMMVGDWVKQVDQTAVMVTLFWLLSLVVR
jgi:hypothetical protein